VQEALDREQRDRTNPISLKTYLNTRRKSIGALPFHALNRWIWKLDLPVLKNPDIEQMVQGSWIWWHYAMCLVSAIPSDHLATGYLFL